MEHKLVVTSPDKWTRVDFTTYYRIWDGFVYRRTIKQFVVNGDVTHKAPLGSETSMLWIGQ